MCCTFDKLRWRHFRVDRFFSYNFYKRDYIKCIHLLKIEVLNWEFNSLLSLSVFFVVGGKFNNDWQYLNKTSNRFYRFHFYLNRMKWNVQYTYRNCTTSYLLTKSLLQIKNRIEKLLHQFSFLFVTFCGRNFLESFNQFRKLHTTRQFLNKENKNQIYQSAIICTIHMKCTKTNSYSNENKLKWWLH